MRLRTSFALVSLLGAVTAVSAAELKVATVR
jgi:hypothetical protein